jgi:hypothetical protein
MAGVIVVNGGRTSKARSLIYGEQASTKEGVEEELLLTSKVIAEPPEPIGAFGDVHVALGACDGLVRARLSRLFEGDACGAQELPGAIIRVASDPDAKARLDPGAGVEPRQLASGQVCL